MRRRVSVHTHTHTCAHSNTHHRQRGERIYSATRPRDCEAFKARETIYYSFQKHTRVRSHPLACGLGAWRRWDTCSSLHLNGASHINHLIRISLTALKLMKSISWTFIQRLIDNVKKKRGGYIFINTHCRLLNAASYGMSNLIGAC